MASIRVFALAALLIVVLAACGAAVPGASPPAEAPATQTAAATPTEAAATATPEACARDNLALKNPGQLTLSTDNPAFPPWWGGDPEEQYPHQPDDSTGWEVSNPYSGEGLEGATAYAVAEALGFSEDEVVWLQNAEFAQAFAPGEKPFDWHMAQVSIRPERAEAVDFSDPYFDSNQSLLAMTANDITDASSISDLQAYRLGAAVNTTSFELIENVIQPTTEPLVFPDNATAKTALENGQIDGLIVDLGSAFYMRDAELEDWDTPDPEATIVGAFSESEQVDQVGMVLEKDSPLTECVNQALAQLEEDGTLDEIYDRWIETGQEIPFFQP